MASKIKLEKPAATEISEQGTPPAAGVGASLAKTIPAKPRLKNRHSALVTQRRRKDLALALLYMSPALALVIIFSYAPLITAIRLSFFITDPRGEAVRFNGLNYYTRILGLDGSGQLDYLRSMWLTIQFSLFTVPLSIIVALGLAMLAVVEVKGIGIFRTIYTSSIAISLASAGAIWSLIYSPTTKVTQWLLDFLGSKASSVLNDPATALPAIAFMTVWSSLGFNFIIMLAGIQAIPRDVYESAALDGGTGWKSFRFITVPLLTPTLLFLLIISVIASFQAFTQFHVLIGSEGPDSSTNVFVYSAFRAFWLDNRYGFASAMSVVLFGVLLGLTIIQYTTLNRRANYS